MDNTVRIASTNETQALDSWYLSHDSHDLSQFTEFRFDVCLHTSHAKIDFKNSKVTNKLTFDAWCLCF